MGTVYFVGTGPGDLGLLTVKGLALIREADALVGNLRVHPRLLREASPEAAQYDIGGFRWGNKWPQAEIDGLLVRLAEQGQLVVRLWEGDPFVFTNAAREMAAVLEAGHRAQAVPGVTSAVAGPAYAGVPVTDWDYSAGFAVVSGFIPPGAPEPDWAALARLRSLVILMPLENLSQIVDKLREAGLAAETPVLAVQQATLPGQQRVVTTLAGLAEAIKGWDWPVLLVVGQLVELAGRLTWFEPEAGHYPLLGERVLVTRPEHQSGTLLAALRDLGAEPVPFPTINIAPLADTSALDAAVQRLAEYDWVVLTSVNGVAAFWAALERAGLDSRALAGVRLAAIGPATGGAMQARGIRPDLLPEVYTAEGVLAAFAAAETVAGRRFLLARADIARKNLAVGLREQGADIDEVAAYRTVPVTGEGLPPAADIITFTSSSTVQGYVNSLQGRDPAEFLRGSRVVCIGPITAGTAERLGVPVTAVAGEYTIPGLLAALEGLGSV